MDDLGRTGTQNKAAIISKKPTLRKKPSNSSTRDEEFMERLKAHCSGVYAEDYGKFLGHMYYLEDNWTNLIGDSCMTDKMRKQQQGIWEFLTTEKNYIRRMRVVCEVFRQIFLIAQREGDLLEINEIEIFGNISEILITNDKIWKDFFVQVINKTRQKRNPIKPSELLAAFNETDELYKSYVNFTLDQEDCLKRIRDYSDIHCEFKRENKRKFKTYLEFCENLPQCERLKLVDLMTEPMQRMTRYPLLLKTIHDYTENVQEKKQLRSMMNKFQGFIFDINKKKREIFEKQKLNQCLDDFEHYNTWTAGNEDVIWVAVDFLRGDVVKTAQEEPRCFLRQDAMKMIEGNKRNETAVEVFLFTDVLVVTRRRNSTKKYLVLKQLFFLDKIRFIKSEISNTSIVFLYLDDHGLLTSSFMLELPERKRDRWLEILEIAKERYERACAGTGSTLEFFQDDNKRYSLLDEPNKLSSGSIKRNSSGKGSIMFLQDRRKEQIEDQNNNRNNNDDEISFSMNSKDSHNNVHQDMNNFTVTIPPTPSSTTTTSAKTTNTSPAVTTPTQDGEHFDDQTETGLNRRTASWVLTGEQKVRSIRSLLREDLWGSSGGSCNNNTTNSKSLPRMTEKYQSTISAEIVDEQAETKSLASASIDSVDIGTVSSSESELSLTNLQIEFTE